VAKTIKLKPLVKPTIGGKEQKTARRRTTKRPKMGPSPKKKPAPRSARAKAAPAPTVDAGAKYGHGTLDLESEMTLPVGKENLPELPDEVALNPRQKLTLLAAAPKMFRLLVELQQYHGKLTLHSNAIDEVLAEAYHRE
jgi:hypothetical protein